MIQLTDGKQSAFTLAANIFTIGLLALTATLIGKVLRWLRAASGA